VEGYYFEVITDHKALKWLFELKNPVGRLGRLVLELQQWDFETRHREGASHHVPDALSQGLEDEEIAAFHESEDPWYVSKLREVEQYPKKYPDWKIDEGLLYRYKRNKLLDSVTNDKKNWKLVVSVEKQERLLADAHCEAFAGHPGVKKKYGRVAREYYWPGVWYDVYEFVWACQECRRYKVARTGKQGLMGRRLDESPWAVVRH